jgi:phosphomevalonate decarboxylase
LKATAVAHPIQGLIKYHGLRNPKLRIPFHDSISVCIEALTTITTVEASTSLKKNYVTINGKTPAAKDIERVEVVLNELKMVAGFRGNFKMVSENSLKTGKGLGFSASGFAALGLAASKALNLNIDMVSLSEIVRLGAGSSTRSLAGGFSIWYSNREGRSYAEQLNAPERTDFSMVIVPIASKAKTDEAHAEVLSSPLFRARLKNVNNLVKKMKKAVMEGNVATIGRLAEEDTLNLHAITMTGKSHMILWEPETIQIMKEVIEMREEGVPAWYSMDTGPSVFINTYAKHCGKIVKRLSDLGLENMLTSRVGGKPFLTSRRLF